jgi:hypothetical protein
VAYHNRRKPNLYPVGAHWMLPDAVRTGDARLQEVEADITDIWNTITPFNKMHLFATWLRR